MKNTISMLNEEYKDIILNYKTYLLYDKQLATNSVNSYIFDIEKYLLFMQNNNIDKISKIKMPIVIPSVDIKDSKEYIFTNKIPIGEGEEKYITDITVGKAVRASSSFPAVFNLCNINSHAFMDGGALNNVPVVEVRKQGADKVIAVKFEGDKIDETSSVMDIVMKTIDIMGNKIIEEELNSSDYIVNICTEKMGLLEINKLKECYQIGYDTVIKNIDKIKKIIEN